VLIAGSLAIYLLRSPQEVLLADIDDHIKPGKQQAVLILSEGAEIDLSESLDMKAISEGYVTIEREGNRLVYRSKDESETLSSGMLYNELRTPRGGSYQLQMEDGSSIYLNAGSSLKFQVSFQDSVREVYLEGEGYFEVAHDGKPFIVHAGQSHTRVLGTSFNISAYKDDPEIVTTLVEGRVQVEASGISSRLVLSPNEQAILKSATAELVKTEVDASGYVSWVNGKLEFHNETLDEVMKRLARWYDFEYIFENEAARDFHFSARLSRDVEISNILEMLEMTTSVVFTYEDGSIVIK
jgi:ferric-dicitrate binding protein FerR (iron transport regulator)